MECLGARIENPDVRQKIVAHHEAGHLVVAAVEALPLRPEGAGIDAVGCGIACYWKDPKGSDDLRKRVLAATFAGFYAERCCCEENGYPAPEENWMQRGDGWEANELINQIAEENLTGGNNLLTGTVLKERSEKLVEENWLAIKAIAAALLAKKWEPLKLIKSEGKWSNETTAKYLIGEEAVRILAQCGIASVCVIRPE